MKTLGRRSIALPSLRPSGDKLRAAARINDAVKALLPGGRIAAPKGIQRAWLAEAMAAARARRK